MAILPATRYNGKKFITFLIQSCPIACYMAAPAASALSARKLACPMMYYEHNVQSHFQLTEECTSVTKGSFRELPREVNIQEEVSQEEPQVTVHILHTAVC
jgi:hypothetical protein